VLLRWKGIPEFAEMEETCCFDFTIPDWGTCVEILPVLEVISSGFCDVLKSQWTFQIKVVKT
jgi:hypothetical protein